MISGVRRLFWLRKDGNGSREEMPNKGGYTSVPDASLDNNYIIGRSRNVFGITLYEQHIDPC